MFKIMRPIPLKHTLEFPVLENYQLILIKLLKQNRKCEHLNPLSLEVSLTFLNVCNVILFQLDPKGLRLSLIRLPKSIFT